MSDRGPCALLAARRELIALQAFAIGLSLYRRPVPPDLYESAFLTALEQLGETGHHAVVLGNIHLADVREWFETRVRAAGLGHIDPLWQAPPVALLDEFIAGGGRAIVTCINTARLPSSWLRRAVDESMAGDLARRPDVDPCGERGEYHTFVYAGPPFAETVPWRPGPIREDGGFVMLEVRR